MIIDHLSAVPFFCHPIRHSTEITYVVNRDFVSSTTGWGTYSSLLSPVTLPFNNTAEPWSNDHSLEQDSEAAMPLGIKPTVDFAFKKIFGSSETRVYDALRGSGVF